MNLFEGIWGLSNSDFFLIYEIFIANKAVTHKLLFTLESFYYSDS